jgi:enoyl-CoA hydratase/carnithine racemase
MSDASDPKTLDTGTDELLCRIDARAAVVTLNREAARNALTPEMKEAMLELLPRLEADPAVGCVLVTGAGAAFCAGGDTKRMSQDGRLPSPAERLRLLHREHRIPQLLHRLEKPTLAALPGPAAGAGLGLALACDLRIAAESAFVTTSYVRLGLSGDYGGSWFLTRLLGPARARELYFTGDRVDAVACERMGLVSRVVPDAELGGAALELAQRLAAGPPTALRFMKHNLNRALTHDLESCLELEAERMVASAQTDDYLEAVRAFGEKRPPAFRGR